MQRVGPSPFGVLLKALRLDAGLTQKALGELAHVSHVTISSLERGTRQYPDAGTLAGLLQGLGTYLDPNVRERFEGAAKAPSRPRPPRKRVPEPGSSAMPPSTTRSEPAPIVGRTSVLADVTELLASHRLVTLVGAAGVGKTRIARELRSAFARTGERGVWIVELAALRDPGLIVETIASVVGVEVSLLDVLAAYLDERNALLIVDNCEHLILPAAAILDSLLRSSDRLRLMVTSRERLNIAGEWTYRVPSMEVPRRGARLSVEALSAIEAVQLFCERAHAVRDGFTLSETSAPFVAEICRRLDGIPLAIELAAGRVGSLGVADIAGLLDQRFRLLTGGNRTALSRHQTMQAAIAWSFDLLTPEERTLFTRTGCFPAGWNLDAANVVCRFGALESSDVLSLLSSLVEKSMVALDVDTNHARYRLLESNRAYALERLGAGDEVGLLERRLAYWVADFADRSRAALPTVPRAAWHSAMVDELQNARAALHWALDGGRDTAIAVRIVMGYRSHWADSGYLAEGLRWLSRLGDVLAQSPNAAYEAALWHSRSLLMTGEHAVRAAQEAIARLEQLDDLENLASATMRLARGYIQQTDYESANVASDHALAIYRQAGLTTSLLYAGALSSKALALVGLGDYRAARPTFTECIALDETLGDRERAAVERLNLAELEFSDGNVELALSHTEATLEVLRGRHDTGVVVCYLNAAAYHIVLGHHLAAQRSAEEALRIARRVGSRLWQAVATQHLATLCGLRGDVWRAARLLGYADACYAAERSGREGTEARTLAILEPILAARLTAAQRTSLEASGKSLTEDEAVELALRGPSPDSP